jgi:hypothetical protein
MKTFIYIGLVEIESCIVSKNNDHIFQPLCVSSPNDIPIFRWFHELSEVERTLVEVRTTK